jgi:ribulose-phosphate 3-epimerase
MVDIIPSILTDNPYLLKKQTKQSKKLFGAVQIDILDDSLVSGKTVLPKDFDELGELFFEAHLMVDHPISYLEDLKKAGFDRVTFHFESKDDPEKTLLKIKNCGFESGIALNPETHLPELGKIITLVDEILVLSVAPGKQGQPFQESVVSKITDIKDLYPEMVVGVDGGIDDKNAPLLESVGANIIYIGHYLWKDKDPKFAFEKLIKALNR